MILGPFTGECSYEIISWVPYLRAKLGDKLKDCVAISRGGTDSWYPCKVLNAYDVVPPEEFYQLLMKRYKGTGQIRNENWNDLDDLIMERFGFPARRSLHPREMWKPPFSNRLMGSFEKLRPVERYPALPEKYVAVRLYENDWYTPKLFQGAFERPKIDSGGLPIVGLVIDTPADNHVEFLNTDCDEFVCYEVRNSLEALSRVVSHAEKFVTSYGGLIYLGLGYGVPTEACTFTRRKSWHHKRDQQIVKECGGSLKIRRWDAAKRVWR